MNRFAIEAVGIYDRAGVDGLEMQLFAEVEDVKSIGGDLETELASVT